MAEFTIGTYRPPHLKRNEILLHIVMVILVIILLALMGVYYIQKGHLQSEFEKEVYFTKNLFQKYRNGRIERYKAECRIITESFDFSDEERTDETLQKVKDIIGCEIIVLTDDTGKVIAWQGEQKGERDSLEDLANVKDITAVEKKIIADILAFPDVLYDAISLPVYSGQEIVRILTVGYKIDTGMLQEYSNVIQCELGFLVGTTLVTSTLPDLVSQEFETALDRYDPLLEKVLRERTEGGPIGIRIGEAGTFATLFVPVGMYESMMRTVLVILKPLAPLEEYLENLRRIYFYVTCIILVGLIIVLRFIIINKVSYPIARMVKAIQTMAAGDFSQMVDVSGGGEVAALAEVLNIMVVRLRDLTSKVREVGNRMTAASHQILTSSEQQASGTVEQASQVAETTVASRQLSSNAEQVGDSIMSVAKTAEEASVAMENMKRIVHTTAKKIEGLGEKSQRIGGIINVINEIAKQTNLLALNAAIEAARAGKQGRGFAIVADEVRKLADRSTKATKDINILIKNIQNETVDTILSVKESNKGVGIGAELATKTAEVSQEITLYMKQQINGSKQIAKAMDEINEVMKHIATSSKEGTASAKHLASLADELKQAVSRLRI